MSHYTLPVLYALFVWWFSTGVIIYLDGLPRRTFRWSMLGATVLLGCSLYGLAASSNDTSLAGAYCAFTTGLLAWGWQEISFYMGFVTGPRTDACPEGCRGWRHFGHAIQTSLYHELAIIVSAATVVALTWNAPNQVGTWTFMILWWMHQSAKLNVFLGVRNLNEEFLPEHLQFLKSFLTRRPMNLLFPVSVTISTVIAVLLISKAVASGASPFQAAGFTFLGTMMTLAILEHWFLVLPLPAAALWHWGLASRTPNAAFEVELITGFLGAGKTTVLQRMLAAADPGVRTVVLVNDFASVGVDGSLLKGRGADVVELPNGCICCSLRSDLARQLQEAIGRWAPQRVLIEPSGVADVAALLGVLERPGLKELVKRLTVHGVIDAGSFVRDHARLPGYFEVQMQLASALILNKSDLVPATELRMIATTLRRLNPRATITPASYGLTQAPLPEPARLYAPVPPTAAAQHDDVAALRHSGSVAHDHAHADGHTRHGHDHDDAVPGLSAWSAQLDSACDPAELEEVLHAVASGRFGAIERVKGIARAGAGWVHFDVAGGRPSIAAFVPHAGEEPRVVAIGRAVDEPGLRAAFAACMAPAVA